MLFRRNESLGGLLDKSRGVFQLELLKETWGTARSKQLVDWQGHSVQSFRHFDVGLSEGTKSALSFGPEIASAVFLRRERVDP